MNLIKNKTKKPHEGDLLRISLGDDVSAFARVLPNSQIAIYEHQVVGNSIVLSDIYDSKILWKLTVMKSAISTGRWTTIDFRQLEPELCNPVFYFIRDRVTGGYSIYRSTDGQTKPSTLEECKELESASVWDAEHIEARIRDYFAGHQNVWVEQLKPK